ncbi:sulfite exporter TauE/SafE family protein [Panacagrimonas sp.]|uniref:sulfite exporter TauE/SafE family protein n=1 Tax=Panacagrimonas sp. TaxID=2480088 RepID=UPI003B51A13E
MDLFLIFVLTGAVAGVLAGLFGIGGGMIMVPALALILPTQDVPADIVMHVALGTSLAVIAATSISSTLTHHRRGGVRWDVLRWFAPGLAIGAAVGAFVADALPGLALRRLVGVSSLLIALQMALDYKFGVLARLRTPQPLELGTASGLIGLLSSLIGIGGGSLTGPYLALRGFELRQSVGTAAAGGIPIAWAGAIGYILAGWGTAGVPNPALGYVSVSAFFSLAVIGTLVAPLGARLAHRLKPRHLQLGFAFMLLCVGLEMLFG